MIDLAQWWPIVTSVCVGCAVYGGIRAELAWMRKSTQDAHARIDEHLDFHLERQIETARKVYSHT